jgi:hypothetical protein
LRNTIASKGLKTPVYDFGMGIKIKMCENKRGGQAGLENRMSPSKVEKRGKHLVIKISMFPPQKEEKSN